MKLKVLGMRTCKQLAKEAKILMAMDHHVPFFTILLNNSATGILPVGYRYSKGINKIRIVIDAEDAATFSKLNVPIEFISGDTLHKNNSFPFNIQNENVYRYELDCELSDDETDTVLKHFYDRDIEICIETASLSTIIVTFSSHEDFLREFETFMIKNEHLNFK